MKKLLQKLFGIKSETEIVNNVLMELRGIVIQEAILNEEKCERLKDCMSSNLQKIGFTNAMFLVKELIENKITNKDWRSK